MKPLVTATIAVAAAAVFSALGRQFKSYGEGRGTWLAALEGRYLAASSLLVLISAAGAALVTLLQDGSASSFFVFLGAFLAFSVAVVSYLLLRGRKL